MNPAYNVLTVSESTPDINWDDIQAVIIRLSHGVTRDSKAAENIAKAQSLGLLIHGYHEYEGVEDEVTFSLNNAESLGLLPGSYLFLVGAPLDSYLGFANNWQSAGWLMGVDTIQTDFYSWLFDSAADVVKVDDTHSLDRSGKLIITPVDPIPKIDESNPGAPEEGAYVGQGVDTTGLMGGTSLGYSTNGNDFYSVITPFGIIFRNIDAQRMSGLLMDKLKLQSPNGTVFSLSVNDDGKLTTVKEESHDS